MNNKQRAAVRRAINQFPGVRPVKNGDVVTLVKSGQHGSPIEITETMSVAQVTQAVLDSCEELS